MILRSMTGYARVRQHTSHGELTLSIKSVNHRGLDLHFHLPPDFDPFENAMRGVLKQQVGRGHVEVRASLVRTRDGAEGALNRPLLEAWLSAFRKASEELGLASQPDLNSALRIPGMFTEPAGSYPDPEFQNSLLAALTEALVSFNVFREREGAEIEKILRERNANIRQAGTRIGQIRDQALPAFQARLTDRLGELLKSATIEPQRLAQEVSILADRSDIHEEVARLGIHARHLDELLDQGGELGKKLDFLLQEMNRETNTILSKTTGIGELGLGITELALATKSDIEKIREQALNLE
ncbi:MAG: YicC family protein [Acidobacteria bacterium]|nr:YicC family protein [Acidobacteriota bacterium]